PGAEPRDPPASGVYPWSQQPDIPAGARAMKEGGGAAAVGEDIYLLKGSGTTEFYSYNLTSGTWITLASAPTGTSGKPFKNGSCIAASEDGTTIYALKGSLNEFFKYDIATNTWSNLDNLPLTGTAGRKKVKDGAGLACLGGYVYALKGGNTLEFWRYDPATPGWTEKEPMPQAGGKKVKGGGSLTRGSGQLWALKGNSTVEFFTYVPGAFTAPNAEPGSNTMTRHETRTQALSLRIAPNPFSGTTTISYTLPSAGPMSLRLYDVTGALVATLVEGLRPAGSSALSVSRSALTSGIYLLKLSTGNTTLTQKLIIE
ncbi:MAG: T9SS type A sorting domain-containing protein, partial [candidate division WOR-3 bacterium]